MVKKWLKKWLADKFIFYHVAFYSCSFLLFVEAIQDLLLKIFTLLVTYQ